MVRGDTTTYVESYVRSDGTKVKGHVRHVHPGDGGGGESRRPNSPGTGSRGWHGSNATSQGPFQSGGSDWSSLNNGWRNGAGPSKAPRGGINPSSLAGRGAFGDSMSVSAQAPIHPPIDNVIAGMSDPATQEMLKATYKRGQVSRTKGQRKWLAAELSDEDRDNLAKDYDESVICSNKVVYMSRHLKDKVARGELSVPQDVVEETLRSFVDSFIEYNVTEYNGKQSRRVLLRNNDISRKVNVRGKVQDANLCLVLDIDTCCMITAYWNAADDHHDTLNRNRYEGRKAHGRRGGNGDGRRHGGGTGSTESKQPSGRSGKSGERGNPRDSGNGTGGDGGRSGGKSRRKRQSHK